jgi:ABC-type lipoprotein release transport system permease subunit
MAHYPLRGPFPLGFDEQRNQIRHVEETVNVIRSVVLQGLGPVAIGLALGGWSACATGLLLFAAFACWLPAARASQVDPASVLRAD